MKQCDDTGITGRLGQNPIKIPDMMHYSFDYAQNVQLSSDPMQVGSLFFLSTRKVGQKGYRNKLVT